MYDEPALRRRKLCATKQCRQVFVGGCTAGMSSFVEMPHCHLGFLHTGMRDICTSKDAPRPRSAAPVDETECTGRICQQNISQPVGQLLSLTICQYVYQSACQSITAGAAASLPSGHYAPAARLPRFHSTAPNPRLVGSLTPLFHSGNLYAANRGILYSNHSATEVS